MEKNITACLNSKWGPYYASLVVIPGTVIICCLIKKYDTIEIGSIKLSKVA